MAIQSGQNVKLSIKEESAYGTAPAGNYSVIPFKSVSLSLAKTNHESAVITLLLVIFLLIYLTSQLMSKACELL